MDSLHKESNMKSILLTCLILLPFSLKAEYWNPGIVEANKIAKRVIKDQDLNYLKRLVTKENLNPDFEFNYKFQDSYVTHSLSILSSEAIYLHGDDEDDKFFFSLLRLLIEELGSDINNIVRNPGLWGDQTTLSVAANKDVIDYLFSEGADYKVKLSDHRGDPRSALSSRFVGNGGHSNALRFKYLVQAGAKPLEDEENCESFAAIDSFYNRSGSWKEKSRIIMRDFFMKRFNYTKAMYFSCADKAIGSPVCATAPQICEETYNSLMKE